MAAPIPGDRTVYGNIFGAGYRGDGTQLRSLAAPRMTSTERDALSDVANGFILYNTTTNKLQVRADGSWADLH